MDFKVWNIFVSKPIIAALGAQISSQVFKIFLPVFKGGRPDAKKFLNYGDFPSAHTAFVVAVVISIGLEVGWGSSIFALGGVIASILIYDIIKMRKTIEINIKLTKKLMAEHNLPIIEKIPQFKGHTYMEVIAGGIWGVICAIIVGFIKI